MKISCQSCQAKYTIADEKVRGKVVKIRCKKCGSTIVVNGNEPSAEGVPSAAPEQDEAPTRVFSYDHHASAGDEWTVNVADGDQRSLTTAQLVDLHREGVVSDETYGWREGMDDWLPLGEIEALRSLLSSGAPAARSAPPAAISVPAPAPAPAAAPAPVGPMFGAAGSPSGGAAARRPGARGANADLFGGSAAAGGDDDVMTSASAKPKIVDEHDKATGARNENSVLFSLSALTATAGPSPSAAKPVGGESSGIVDIKNLVAPGPARPAPARSGVDDIMNLGGGAMFAPSLAVPALAPPPTADLTSAPAFADEPGAAPAAGKKPGGKGAMLGIIGAVAVVAIGAGAFFALGGKKDDGAKPADTTAAIAATAPATAATTAAATVTATAAPAPADSAPAAVAAADKPDDKDKGKTETAAVAPGSTPQRGSKTEKTEKAAPAEKPPSAAAAAAAAAAATPAPAATPAAPAADGAPFDRAAAMSALSSAASAASGCKKPDGPTGSGRVSVTFAPSGNATTANVEGPPFAGTSVGGCVAARFRGARVPPFSGGTVTVHKSFSIN